MTTVTVSALVRPLSIAAFFRWYDLWIGAYWDRKEKVLYVCPLPMIGLKITMPMWSRWAPCWCPFMSSDHRCGFHRRGPSQLPCEGDRG